MTIEDAREYLKSYGVAINKVERYEKLLEYAKADLENPHLTIAGMNIGGHAGSVSDPVATPVLKMLDIENELNELVRDSNRIAEELSKIINKMPKTDGKTYLIEIYLLLRPPKQVLYSAHRGRKQFYAELNKALNDFCEAWQHKKT